MAHTPERRLIVITGPVGAGKSATSLALADVLRRPDVAVAVIDLDQVYGFVRQRDGYGELDAWDRARRGAAALADRWFDSGVSVVIVDGEFFTGAELAALTGSLQGPATVSFFTLQLNYERTLEHVLGDPTRGASRDPAFLRSLHEHFVRSLPFLRERSVVIPTDALTVEQVVAQLAAELGRAP